MKRRDLVLGASPLVLSGCLRLSENADKSDPHGNGDDEGGDPAGQSLGSDETGDGAEEGATTEDRNGEFDLRASIDHLPEFVPGVSEAVPFTVENDGDGPFEGEILLLLDRELEATTTVDLRPHTAVSTEFSVAIDELGGRTVELEARAGEYREVLLETHVDPVWEPLVLDWQDAYVPADDPDNSGATADDDRSLSYGCQELYVESGDEILEAYDIGVVGEEPNFLEGAYTAVDDPEGERGTFRFFGTEAGRTVLTFDEGPLSAATRIRLEGFVPGMESVDVAVSIGEVPIGDFVFADAAESHAVPLPEP